MRRANLAQSEGAPRTKTALHQALMQSGRLGAFQKLLWQLLNSMNALDKDKWVGCIKGIGVLLGLLKPPQELLDFLAWEDCSGATPASGTKSVIQSEGIYLHRVGDVLLPIRFDSIHGVNGETRSSLRHLPDSTISKSFCPV